MIKKVVYKNERGSHCITRCSEGSIDALRRRFKWEGILAILDEDEPILIFDGGDQLLEVMDDGTFYKLVDGGATVTCK